MLRYLSLVVAICTIAGNSFSQNTLFGKVTDGATHIPLPYVNVYINNSTIGTVTDDRGNYSLFLLPGEHQVVFSFVGYISHKVTTSIQGEGVQMNIELFPVKRELATVTVRDKVDKEWEKLIKQFEKVFLGDNYAGRYCTIQNAWCVDFKTEKISRKRMLRAYASQPLEIENLALGYKLLYDLENFSSSRERDMFNGNVFFVELEPRDSVQSEIWARNRRDAYLGSSHHLFKSILSGRLSEEGFIVSTTAADKIQRTPYVPSDLQFDSVKNKYRIPIENKIEIRYQKSTANILVGEMDVTSKYVEVDPQGGVLNPLDIILTGYIGKMRVANLLPIDYEHRQAEVSHTLIDKQDNSVRYVNDVSYFPEPSGIPAFTALDSLEKKSKYYFENHPIEKVYLHFDKPFYILGEDSWYKAYVLNGSDLHPTGVSSVLYVDWIDPLGKIISHNQLRIENGGSAGDLAIDSTFADGTYTVRAYTNWMRNESPQLFFSRKIRIIDPRIHRGIPSDEKEKISIDLQFFPEGGSLVEGVQTRLAFKAIDSHGRSIDVNGKIIDDQNRLVTTFRSSHGGMGSFPFIADTNKSFRAILSDGAVYQLPQPRTSGYSLAASNMSSDKILVRIRCTAFNDPHLYLIGHSRGSIHYAESIGIEEASEDISISKKELPEGILQLTLLSSKGIPLCERMLFIQKGDNKRVSIRSDKEDYAPRDSIMLNLEFEDTDHDPLKTSISVSVTDADFVDVDNYSETIYTRLLLQSDLKGNVENPGWYFESQNSERMYALDLVMLTHGWSRFDWNKILSPSDSVPLFLAETGLTIKGQVLAVNKAVQKAPFTMRIAQPDGDFINIYETDSLGYFIVQDLDFPDSTLCSWRVMGGRKGRVQNAEIRLDTALYLPPFNNPRTESASLAVDHELLTKLIDRFTKTGIWSVDNTIVLDEVVVKAERLKIKAIGINTIAVKPGPEDIGGMASTFVNRYAPGLSSARLITRSDGTYTWTTQQGAPIMISINGVMQDTTGLGANPFVVINKTPIEHIETVIISGGSVAIITKREIVEEAASTISHILNGYHKAREFYHPKYGPLDIPQGGPDNRTTLYWNPDLQMDEEGKASVRFYNTDSTQRLFVVVEGISKGKTVSISQIIGPAE